MTSTHTPQRLDTAGVPTPTAPGSGRRSAAPRDRALVVAVAAVTVVSLAGSVLAVATALSPSWWDAVGPTARLSVPLPMNIALVVLALTGAGTHRRAALAASALLGLACSVAVVSGFFDGGYVAALAPMERVAQAALVLALTATAALAVRRVRRLAPPPRA